MSSKKSYLVGFMVILVIYLAFSFITYKQYGITSDEFVEYQSGKALLNYYETGKDSYIFQIAERHFPTKSTYFRGHLALFSLINTEGHYEKYHLLNLIFALPIFLMFYSLLFFVYKNNWIAGLGTLTLFFTPRFLGDIPANPKDVPFAVFFFLSLGAIRLLDKKLNRASQTFILGILFGITSSFRLLGVSLFVIYGLYLFFTLDKLNIRNVTKAFINSGLIFLVALCVLVISLPLFQENAFVGLKSLIKSTSNFEYWDNKMLFMGEFITKGERPAYYLPFWILITTPLYILFMFLASPIVLILKKAKDYSLYLLMYLAITVNLILYFIFNPVIYNALRHFLFLVPIITFLAVISFFDFVEHLKNFNKKVTVIFMSSILLLLLLTVKSFAMLHPYEYAYFNELIGGLKGAQGNYDSDYWGASYKESSEWIRETFARRESTNVKSCDMAFAVDYYSFKLFQMVFKDEEADFIVCDFDNFLQKENYKNLPIIYEVKREGATLNVVLDVRGENATTE